MKRLMLSPEHHTRVVESFLRSPFVVPKGWKPTSPLNNQSVFGDPRLLVVVSKAPHIDKYTRRIVAAAAEFVKDRHEVPDGSAMMLKDVDGIIRKRKGVIGLADALQRLGSTAQYANDRAIATGIDMAAAILDSGLGRIYEPVGCPGANVMFRKIDWERAASAGARGALLGAAVGAGQGGTDGGLGGAATGAAQGSLFGAIGGTLYDLAGQLWDWLTG